MTELVRLSHIEQTELLEERLKAHNEPPAIHLCEFQEVRHRQEFELPRGHEAKREIGVVSLGGWDATGGQSLLQLLHGRADLMARGQRRVEVPIGTPPLGGRVIFELPQRELVVEVGRQIEDVPRIVPFEPGGTAEFDFLEHGVDAQPVLPIVRVLEPDEARHGPLAHVEIAHRHQLVAIVDAHFARIKDCPVEAARQILVQGGVDESLETVLVKGIQGFLLGIRLGAANAEGEAPVTPGQALALALLEREAVQVHADVHDTENAGLDAEQVHLVQHDAAAKPPRRQILVVALGGQLAGKMRLDEHHRPRYGTKGVRGIGKSTWPAPPWPGRKEGRRGAPPSGAAAS